MMSTIIAFFAGVGIGILLLIVITVLVIGDDDR